MNITKLPDEVLILIIERLDLRSTYNFYKAYIRIRAIMRTYGVIKTCNLSRSVMGSAETIKLDFFKDISKNLLDLNVCGVNYLYKAALLPIAKRMQCLHTLDVTYTNINIHDLVHIYNACPTIKDISINFSFSKSQTKLKEVKLNKPDIARYQKIFKNFVNVHFLGNLHIMMYSQLPSLILKEARLKKLQYTIINCDPTHSPLTCTNQLQFENFTIYVSNTKVQMSPACMSHHFANLHDIQNHGSLNLMSPFDVLDFVNYEIIVILRKHSLTSPLCYASPIFENFLNKQCIYEHQVCMDINLAFDFTINLFGNSCVMLWNKSTTTFDAKFFLDLWSKLKPFLPCCFDSASATPLVSDFDFYVTIPQELEHQPVSPPVGLKRKRQVIQSCVLNYDTAFQEKSSVQLTLMFESNIKSSVTLSSNSNYLKKLTFLSLSGHIRYNFDFFNTLFRCCDQLVTLSVKANSCCSCFNAIGRALPLSRSIKNIQLIDRSIDFPSLFVSMSQCELLENVHILDTADSTNFSNPSIMLNKCQNLYCLYLYIFSSCNAKKRCQQILKQANLTSQQRSVVRILSNNHLICDPFSDVFQLNLM